MAYWKDNADSYICSACGYECNNPNKLAYGPGICPKCKAEMNKGSSKLATSELKSCPACGGDGSLSINIRDKVVFGSCWYCGYKGPVVQYSDSPTNEDIRRAIEGWNGLVREEEHHETD